MYIHAYVYLHIYIYFYVYVCFIVISMYTFCLYLYQSRSISNRVLLISGLVLLTILKSSLFIIVTTGEFIYTILQHSSIFTKVYKLRTTDLPVPKVTVFPFSSPTHPFTTDQSLNNSNPITTLYVDLYDFFVDTLVSRVIHSDLYILNLSVLVLYNLDPP